MALKEEKLNFPPPKNPPKKPDPYWQKFVEQPKLPILFVAWAFTA